MPTYTYGRDRHSKAGGKSFDEFFRESAALDAENRAAQNDARAVVRDARDAQREKRMAESQALNDEVKKWEFEKQKTLDSNAAAMKIATDKEAIVAANELFKIKTDSPDAHAQLADWGAKHFRTLDDKTGDPRLIRQFQINTSRADTYLAAATHAQEIKDTAATKAADAAAAKAAEAENRRLSTEASSKLLKDAGLTVSGASIGERGDARPTFKPPEGVAGINTRLKDEFGVALADVQNPAANMRRVDPARPITTKSPSQGDPNGSHYAFDIQSGPRKGEVALIPVDRFKSYADEYAKATGAATASSVPPATPSSVTDQSANDAAWQRRDAKLAAPSAGVAVSASPAVPDAIPVVAPSAPAKLDFSVPEEFTSVFTAAAPGAVIHYKGQPYTKPAPKPDTLAEPVQ